MYIQNYRFVSPFPLLAREAAALFPVASPFALNAKPTPPEFNFMPRNTPSPSKTQPKRTAILSPCRVTKTELEKIKSKAAEAHLSVSEFQRQALLKSVIHVRNNLVDVAAVKELSAIGHNLNQFVKAVHTHRAYDRQRANEILDALDILIMRLVDGS